MEITVIGAGIIGSCIAWTAAKQEHRVVLFEQDSPMVRTNQSSSKLLYGGLRYLETGQSSLVQKALQARRFWLEQAPQFCRPLELLFPIYGKRSRPRWQIGIGTKLYGILARGSGFPRSRWLDRQEVLARNLNLLSDDLRDAYSFYDAQMSDYALGKWVVGQYRQLGVEIRDGCKISSLGTLSGFDRIANAAGPQAIDLRKLQNGTPAYTIDWVRGSHIFIDRPQPHALILPVLNEKWIFFIPSYQGKTLIGATKIRQDHPQAERPSENEIGYLLDAYSAYHREPLNRLDVGGSSSNVRPLLKSTANPSDVTREWAFEHVGNVLHIYGGKWTTSQIQGEDAVKELLK